MVINGNMIIDNKNLNLELVNVKVLRMKPMTGVKSKYVTTEAYMKLYRAEQEDKVEIQSESILCNSEMKLVDINELARKRDMRERKKRAEDMEKAYKKYYLFGV